MNEFIETALNERRSLEQALAEIAAKYERTPPGQTRDGLARMIQLMQAEIARRKAALQGRSALARRSSVTASRDG